MCFDSTSGIVFAIVFALALFLAILLAVSYLLSTELEPGTKRASVVRLMRYIPIQSIKVVIVACQIVIQVRWSNSVDRVLLFYHRLATLVLEQSDFYYIFLNTLYFQFYSIISGVVYIPRTFQSCKRDMSRLLRVCPVDFVAQFVSVANVQYPHEYQRFLDGVKLLDVDLGWMLSASCVVDIDFHDRLLFATIGPIAIIILLGMTYYIAARRNR